MFDLKRHAQNPHDGHKHSDSGPSCQPTRSLVGIHGGRQALTLMIAGFAQTLELEESQRDAEELGGVMGPGRGKVIATKGSAQKGWQ